MQSPIINEDISKRKVQIMNRFNEQYQKRQINDSLLDSLRIQILKRQEQLVRLTTQTQKEISKYFMHFQPLSCNQANFNDLKLFGGPKIAINQNKLYIGTIVDGKRHGKGVIISHKGKIFQGQLLLNQRNGVGVQIYQNGNFYIGNFINSKRQGQGKMVWINKDTSGKVAFQYYAGSWKDGEPHGYGLHSTEEWKFLGLFKNGIRNGKGIQIKGSTIFEGSYINNKKEGKGFYLQQGVQFYEGQFKNGSKNGYGKHKSFISQQQFQGFFQQNKKEGIGTYKNRKFTYIGLFTQDKPNGTGEFIYNKTPSAKRKYDDERVTTELVGKKDKNTKRNQLQSAQFVRSKVNNHLKSELSQKSIQKITIHKKIGLKHMQSEQKTLKTQRSNMSKPPLSLVKKYSLAQNPQKHICSYKHCSCHKWTEDTNQKLKIDEQRLMRLFSARKTLLKNIV